MKPTTSSAGWPHYAVSALLYSLFSYAAFRLAAPLFEHLWPDRTAYGGAIISGVILLLAAVGFAGLTVVDLLLSLVRASRRPKPRQLRVAAFTHREPEDRGYVGYKSTSYQELQERRWWGWEVLDEEIVPDHVRISEACFGDTGNPPWRSKFAPLGSWGRDGVFTPHPDKR